MRLPVAAPPRGTAVTSDGGMTGHAGAARTRLLRYGDHPDQWAELTVPPDGPAPVAVLVHGGFWKAAYGAEYARPLAPSLQARGWATLVVEYRRVGHDGGYPATLEDVAAAVDLLAGLHVGPVVAVGHSAGGQLAAWLAARPRLPDGAPGARPRVRVDAVVAQAGVLDLRRAAHEGLGGGAVERFLGGTAEQVPERYAVADPTASLPLGVPVLCLHADADDDVPMSQTHDFVARSRAAGDAVEVVEAGGDHYAVIDPDGPAWAATLHWLDHLRT